MNCSLDGCQRPVKARGLCQGHYTRLQRHGDPGTAELWDRQRPTCIVDDCDRLARAHGLCYTHRSRVQRTGTTDPPVLPSNWKGTAVTYEGAHSRVTATRGPASSHFCECGRPAQDWSYDNQDPLELIGTGRDLGKPYSADPDRYKPMCRSCHKRADLVVRPRRFQKRPIDA